MNPKVSTRLSWTVARKAGWAARGEGVARVSNPYPERYGSMTKRREWFVGWDERHAVEGRGR